MTNFTPGKLQSIDDEFIIGSGIDDEEIIDETADEPADEAKDVIKNPQGVINALAKVKAANAAIKAENVKMKTALAAADKVKSDAENKALEDSQNWKDLLTKKEADFATQLKQINDDHGMTLKERDDALKAALSERDALSSTATTKAAEAAVLRVEKAVIKSLKSALDPDADTDYLFYKFGNDFAIGEDKKLTYQGKPFDDAAQTAFKADSDTKMLWRKIKPEGAGGTPGQGKSGGTDESGDGVASKVVKISVDDYSNNDLRVAWMKKEGIKPADFGKGIKDGSIKMVKSY